MWRGFHERFLSDGRSPLLKESLVSFFIAASGLTSTYN
jgi:hypothetical protein